MTNIWADSFKEIRKPFFETESLEEEKAKRDYDGDGKIESGAKEYRGSVHNAIQKKKGGKPDGQDTSSVKEENEIEEGMSIKDFKQQRSRQKQREKRAADKIAPNRRKDIHTDRLSPERAARHRANVDPDDDRGSASDERNYPGGKLRAKKVRKAKALGELGERYEYIDEVNDSKETKLDVRKGIKNKVEINPQVKEELETWIGELVEEGYDLSQFTWREMLEIYESAEFIDEGTAGMPAAGDAQTVTVDPIAAAKAKAAKAKVAKERADLQVAQQSQRMKVSTNESFDSIVEYLSQRPNAFENLEEGVFDPKKSKMRSASARSQRSMTDAQRKAANKESERTAAIHSKGETVLAGMRSSGSKGKVKTTPAPKATAPKANRTVKGRYDKLAKAASDVLKDIKNK